VISELIYTSSPQGLRPDASGFCTVAITAGLSKPLITKLELLSGYEFLYKLSDPNVQNNPINYAHTIISASGRSFHVLSRVGFCGSDYSGRANKIAHHFLLSRDEQCANGPAGMIQEFELKNYFKHTWQDVSRELPALTLNDLPEVSSQPRLNTWKQLTNDCGWAGKFIEAIDLKPKTPSYIIYEPGMNILGLFQEALSLIPPDDRWKVGFSTYYSQMPSGCFYHWRALVKGTSAMKEVQRFPDAVVLDLTSSLPSLPSNSFVESARNEIPIELMAAQSIDSPASSYEKTLEITSSDQTGIIPLMPEEINKSDFPAIITVRSDASGRAKRRKKIYWAFTVMGILSIILLVGILWVLENGKHYLKYLDFHHIKVWFDADLGPEANNVQERFLCQYKQKEPEKQDEGDPNNNKQVPAHEENQTEANLEPPIQAVTEKQKDDNISTQVASNKSIPTENEEILPEWKTDFIKRDSTEGYKTEPRYEKDGRIDIGKASGFLDPNQISEISCKIENNKISFTIQGGGALQTGKTVSFGFPEENGKRYLKYLGPTSYAIGSEDNYLVLEAVNEKDKIIYQCRRMKPKEKIFKFLLTGQEEEQWFEIDYPINNGLYINKKNNDREVFNVGSEFSGEIRIDNKKVTMSITAINVDAAKKEYQQDIAGSEKKIKECNSKDPKDPNAPQIITENEGKIEKSKEQIGNLLNNYKQFKEKMHVTVIDSWGLPVYEIHAELPEIEVKQ